MIAVRRLFQAVRTYLTPAARVTAHRIAPEPAPPTPAPCPQRVTAVEILRNEPNLSASELAERAGVTLSYANNLVRRRRPRPVAMAPSRTIAATPEDKNGDRLKEQIYAAANAGTSVPQLAEQFGLFAGEIEFALKVARLSGKKV